MNDTNGVASTNTATTNFENASLDVAGAATTNTTTTPSTSTGGTSDDGKEFFNYEGVLAHKEKLDGYFQTFADVFKEANDYMNENIDVTPDSALFGTRGSKFLELWNSNIATFSDFYENLDTWGKTMLIVSNNYQEYEDAIVKYKSDGSSLSGVSTLRANAAEQYNDTLRMYGDAEGTGSENPADTTLSTSPKGEYFIQRGDICSVHDTEVEFFGRDGSYNYYLDENKNVLIDDGEKLLPLGVNEATFNINYLKDDENGWYGAVSTNAESAGNMGLPAQTTIQASNAEFDAYGMRELVEYGTPENVYVPEINESFSDAVLNHKPVIQVNNTLESPGWDIFTPDIKSADGTPITLVYDERSNAYYQLGSNGTYERDGYGYTPEELAKYDIEKHS